MPWAIQSNFDQLPTLIAQLNYSSTPDLISIWFKLHIFFFISASYLISFHLFSYIYFFFHILWKWNCYWSLAEKAIKWADGLGDGGMGSGEVNEIRRSDPSGSSFTGLGWPGASSPSGPSASFTTSSGIHLSRVIIQRYLFYGRFWRICGHLRG